MANAFVTSGMFSWVELMTNDPKAAKDFYSQVFGWQFKFESASDVQYTEILVAGRSAGGIMPTPAGCPVPPCWSNYVTVADIASVVAQAPLLGGSITFGPKDIPGVGRCAVVRDGQGASLLAIQYAMKTMPADPSFNPMTTTGAFSWVELMTSDRAAARRFYGGLFGWTFGKMSDFDYEMVKAGDQAVAGLMGMPPDCPAGTPPCWSVYVTVTGADETCAKAKELGGKVLVSPRDIPTVGRFAVIQDPQGAIISLFQWAR